MTPCSNLNNRDIQKAFDLFYFQKQWQVHFSIFYFKQQWSSEFPLPSKSLIFAQLYRDVLDVLFKFPAYKFNDHTNNTIPDKINALTNVRL